MSADLDALVDIYLDTAGHHAAIEPSHFRVPARTDAAERLARILAAGGESSAYLVAEVDGAVVGSLTIRAEPPPSSGSMLLPIPTAEVGIAVLEAWRGRGIGSALMAEAERWGVGHGIARIVLDTAAGNGGALRLYRRLGYAVESHLLFKRISGT